MTPNTPPTTTNPIRPQVPHRLLALAGRLRRVAARLRALPSQCVEVFRDGVQAGTCSIPGNAEPSTPCVDGTPSQPGGPGTDIEITVLTLSRKRLELRASTIDARDRQGCYPRAIRRTSSSRPTAASARRASRSTTTPDGTLSNTQTYADVAPGDNYSVTEPVPAGWRLDTATCDDGSPVSDISLSPGETVTCTFTNEKKRQRSSCARTRQPDDPQDFEFSAGGGLTPTSFQLDDDGNDGNELSNSRSFDVDAGNRLLADGDRAGRVGSDGATCDDGSPVTDISVSIGETVNCTFTNAQARPDRRRQGRDARRPAGLRLLGRRRPHARELPARRRRQRRQRSRTRGRSTTSRPATGYSVSETVPAEWDQTSATCDDGSLIIGHLGIAGRDRHLHVHKHARPGERAGDRLDARLPRRRPVPPATSPFRWHPAPTRSRTRGSTSCPAPAARR